MQTRTCTSGRLNGNAEPPTSRLKIPNTNLAVREAAIYLGISERYLRELVARREIDHVRFGKRILFRPADLDRFISDNAVEAAS